MAAGLTGLSFVLMIVTTRLPRALAEDNALVQYGFGTLFGLAIIGLLPYLLAKPIKFLPVENGKFAAIKRER